MMIDAIYCIGHQEAWDVVQCLKLSPWEKKQLEKTLLQAGDSKEKFLANARQFIAEYFQKFAHLDPKLYLKEKPEAAEEQQLFETTEKLNQLEQSIKLMKKSIDKQGEDIRKLLGLVRYSQVTRAKPSKNPLKALFRRLF